LLKKQIAAIPNSSEPTAQKTYRNAIARIGSGIWRIRAVPKLLINLAVAVMNINAPAEYVKKRIILVCIRFFTSSLDPSPPALLEEREKSKT
jgi:hypothetical protein